MMPNQETLTDGDLGTLREAVQRKENEIRGLRLQMRREPARTLEIEPRIASLDAVARAYRRLIGIKQQSQF